MYNIKRIPDRSESFQLLRHYPTLILSDETSILSTPITTAVPTVCDILLVWHWSGMLLVHPLVASSSSLPVLSCPLPVRAPSVFSPSPGPHPSVVPPKFAPTTGPAHYHPLPSPHAIPHTLSLLSPIRTWFDRQYSISPPWTYWLRFSPRRGWWLHPLKISLPSTYRERLLRTTLLPNTITGGHHWLHIYRLVLL